MQFSKVLPPLFSEMEKQNIDFAMIGGVALYAHGIERTTFDVDFLILHDDAESIEPIEDLMTRFHLYIDWERTRFYFKLFNRDAEFKKLKKKTS